MTESREGLVKLAVFSPAQLAQRVEYAEQQLAESIAREAATINVLRELVGRRIHVAAQQGRPFEGSDGRYKRAVEVLAAPADAAHVILRRYNATHVCKFCGALWTKNPPSPEQPEGSWSLASLTADKCCDNVAMRDQIVPVRP